MRPNLLTAGIFNILAGIVWVMIGMGDNNFTLAIGSFVIVTGVIFIMYSRMKIEEVVHKKNAILTLSIFLYPFNIISAIITSIEYDLIKRDYAKYKKLNNIQDEDVSNNNAQVAKEVRRVDTLLKIGVTMVAIAGVMIVTTSWEAITDVIKFVLLVIIGFLFFGLSKFSEIKLKIRNTTIAYWLLSMISFGLSVFLIGYGQLLGDWFCINGEGEKIFMSVFTLTIALLTYLTYRKCKITAFLYAAYVAITISVLFVLSFLEQEPKICVLIIAIILLIINAIPRLEKQQIKIIKNFSMVVTYILTAFVLVQLVDLKDDIIVAANLIIQIVSLIVLGLTEKSETSKVLSSLSVMLLATVATNYLLVDVDEIYKLIITRSIFILMAVLICAIILRDSKINNLFLGIALPLVILSVIYHIDIAVALFVGCVALIMVIFGAIKKQYKAIYVEGIVFTIMNLVIQLWDLWGELPLYVYLLIGGFILIGIVTIKELKKSNKEEDGESTEVSIENNNAETEKVEVVSNQAIDNNVKEVTEAENKDEQI